MRIAIVHYWFVSLGGGERVTEVLAEMFPDADIFALVVDPKFIPKAIAQRGVTSSFLQRLPRARSIHRHLMPLYPLAVEQLDLSQYDLVLTSDCGPMKGVVTRQDAIHICYCNSMMRYLSDEYHSYMGTMPALGKLPFAFASHYIRAWDYIAAQRVTHFVANSDYMAGRISHHYRRTSTVIYPPIDTERGFLSDSLGDHYLSVGRFVPYKRTEILIEACNRLRRPLRVIGTGPEEPRLRAMAGPTIEFLGAFSGDRLWRAYAQCRALLFAADEDFGMVPLEAQACGRPVIAYGKGGALETVRACNGLSSQRPVAKDEATGVFFFQQTVESAIEGILAFEATESSFSPQSIQVHARKFDTAIFVDRMGELLSPWLGRADGGRGPDRPS